MCNSIMPLVSLLYSGRANHALCQRGLAFLARLLRLELVRVDFAIGKCGLLQVLFNLLRYFSDVAASEQVLGLVSDLRQMFSLITKLLIRYVC